MARVKFSEDLRPLSDLETRTSEVVKQAHTTGRAVVLTQEGRGVAVLLSLEAFEDLQSSAERLELQRAVEDAEQDIAAGNWVEHPEILAKLKRWSAGEVEPLPIPYFDTTSIARCSISSFSAATPRIVRETGTVGRMPTPWCREPSCLSTCMPVQVTR
jgi:prevent-host-death family protein